LRRSPADARGSSRLPHVSPLFDRTITMTHRTALSILAGRAAGPILRLDEPLSFWGGVDPATAKVIDTRHPQHGACLSGAVVMMSTTRGSCSGSGVVLEMALSGVAPAALVFAEVEDVATLGALVAAEMFERPIPVLRLDREAFDALAMAPHATIDADAIQAGALVISVSAAPASDLALDEHDRAMLDGSEGEAAAQAMRILVAMARQQGAARLIDVTRAHIDGCIYAGPANLVFAEAMEAMGGRVRVPTTMNAISVDREGWQRQGVPRDFGEPAARLADAYVRMGCRPTFTCAPYLLDEAPQEGEPIGWSESNAVIFANSVLGARTAKHPDFLDLCIAITGRAPLAGAFLDEERRARVVIDVDLPAAADASIWPLIGYLAGTLAPDRIPLLRSLAAAAPTQDDLKALCAAFGTTSAAPMLHVEGVTPEAQDAAAPDAAHAAIGRADLVAGWRKLNDGPSAVDLVAIGSPHASLAECRALADALGGRRRQERVAAIVTAGRQVLAEAERDGTRQALAASGVEMIPDLCWCSISRPVFPVEAKTVITTSGKYAHYGPGLSGCAVRLGTLDDCVEALLTGSAPARLPAWLV
jgi:predicted aconitase/predicted aconitase with swiveling domain